MNWGVENVQSDVAQKWQWRPDAGGNGLVSGACAPYTQSRRVLLVSASLLRIPTDRMLEPVRKIRFLLAPLLVISLGVVGFFPPSASMASAAEAKRHAATMKCCCGGATAECCSKSCCRIDRQEEAPPVPKPPTVRRIDIADAAVPIVALATPLHPGSRPDVLSSAHSDLAAETLQSEWVRIQV